MRQTAIVPSAVVPLVHPLWPGSALRNQRFVGPRGNQHTFTRRPGEHAACSLDDPEQISPKDHTRTSSKLSWVRLADRLPEYLETRQEEQPSRKA
jgi:hypothetical protein